MAERAQRRQQPPEYYRLQHSTAQREDCCTPGCIRGPTFRHPQLQVFLVVVKTVLVVLLPTSLSR